MNEELSLELAKLFRHAWNMFTDGTDELLHMLMVDSNTPLVEHVIATQEDVDNGDTPEGCEEGDPYYVLSALGIEAWNLSTNKEE